jgi:hypothetical protein
MQREGPMSSESSFLAAMELCDLAAPVDSDPVHDREVEQTRALGAKLKKPWVARHA